MTIFFLRFKEKWVIGIKNWNKMNEYNLIQIKFSILAIHLKRQLIYINEVIWVKK